MIIIPIALREQIASADPATLKRLLLDIADRTVGTCVGPDAPAQFAALLASARAFLDGDETIDALQAKDNEFYVVWQESDGAALSAGTVLWSAVLAAGDVAPDIVRNDAVRAAKDAQKTVARWGPARGLSAPVGARRPFDYLVWEEARWQLNRLIELSSDELWHDGGVPAWARSLPDHTSADGDATKGQADKDDPDTRAALLRLIQSAPNPHA
jgi:hypothetical protein